MLCEKCKNEPKWYDFVFSKEFNFFMVLVKICALIALLTIAWLFVTEIEVVKFLNYDNCAYCMEKTGATCYLGVGNTTRIVVDHRHFNAREYKDIFASVNLTE